MSHCSYQDIFEILGKSNSYGPIGGSGNVCWFSKSAQVFAMKANTSDADTKLLNNAMGRFDFLYPPIVVPAEMQNNWCTALRNYDEFVKKKGRPDGYHVTNEAYKKWKAGIKDTSLLNAIKEHLKSVFDYSILADLFLANHKTHGVDNIISITALNEYKERISTDIIEKYLSSLKAALKSESISQYTGAGKNSTTEPSDPHFEGKVKEFLELIEDSPMDAVGVLCALALIESFDEESEEIVQIVFDYFSNLDEKKEQEYYEGLWKGHCKGSALELKALDNSSIKFKCKHNRDLIDYYVLPIIKNVDGDKKRAPFSYFEKKKVKHIISGAGFGKTSLLDMLLLCCVLEKIKSLGLWRITTKKDQAPKYATYKQQLFGQEDVDCFPIFIPAYKFNNLSLDEFSKEDVTSFVIKMADQGDNPTLKMALKEKKHLLVLIDSIDEVEMERIPIFLDFIRILTDKYPEAHIVQTSRPLGRKPYSEYEELELSALKDEDIYSIICTVTPSYEDIFKESFTQNADLFHLSHNPLMLFIIIDEVLGRDGDLPDFEVLMGKIIGSLIDVRWSRWYKGVEAEHLKYLLGYLAIFMIKNKETDSSLQSFGKDVIMVILNEAPDVFLEKGLISGMHKKRMDESVAILRHALSVQCGILINDRTKEESYLFQEPMVMDWLAANYLNEALILKGIKNKEDQVEIVKDWLSQELDDEKNVEISMDLIRMIAFLLVMLSEKEFFSEGVQAYLYEKENLASNAEEMDIIEKGYEIVSKRTYGENGLRKRKK